MPDHDAVAHEVRLRYHQCAACSESFPSRTQLFRHLEEEGHYESEDDQEHWSFKADRAVEVNNCDLRSNYGFEQYYGLQSLCSPEKWSKAMHLFRQPLPVTVRLNRSARFFDYTRRLFVDKPDVQLAQPPFDLAEAFVVENSSRERPIVAALQEVGAAHRQELASLVPPLLLKVEPQHLVLDLCAAPGSKSLQLLDCMHAQVGEALRGVATQNDDKLLMPTGMLVMNDINRARAVTIAQRSRRQLRTPMLLLSADARKFPTLWAHVSGRCGARKLRFDRILADVPCSGDGTLRKQPSLWKRWNVTDGLSLHYMQLRILKRGMSLLKVGGRLCYSTCSLNPIECEAVVAAALHSEGLAFRLCALPAELPCEPGLSTWRVPHPRFGQSSEDTIPQASEGAFDMFSAWDEVPENLRRQGQRSGPLCSTMFPPKDDIKITDSLHRCGRVLPVGCDAVGGFFVALIERMHGERSSQVAAGDESSESEHDMTGENDKDDEQQNCSKEDVRVLQGIVKAYNPRRGYGFLECADTSRMFSRDIYFTRQDALVAIGTREDEGSYGNELSKGDVVSFILTEPEKGKPQASCMNLLRRNDLPNVLGTTQENVSDASVGNQLILKCASVERAPRLPNLVFAGVDDLLLHSMEAFWGLVSDPVSAAASGVRPWPRELVRINSHGHICLVSSAFASLVDRNHRKSKNRLPIIEGGLCLFAHKHIPAALRKHGQDMHVSEVSDDSEPVWCPFAEAAVMLGSCASRRILRFNRESMRQLLSTESGARPSADIEAGGVVIALGSSLETTKDESMPHGIAFAGQNGPSLPMSLPLFLPGFISHDGQLQLPISERYRAACLRLLT
eukprot:TRINITY_DN7913_c0_g2_i1.p1 TRINITY_DN7913_c0_g2~~TRINITY_DN7913_c0_g2_i1.p1  ORF type:complete len:846 (+),score=79.74 TRINITY_DN7913_c0_g2_i1:158-2695(+)